MAKDIFLIIMGWLIPLVLAWFFGKVPFVKSWLDKHSQAKGALIALLLSILTAATGLVIYHQYFVPVPVPFPSVEKGTVLFTDENGTCPSGYVDESTMLIPRWHEALHKYQTPKDALNPTFYDQERKWFVDHVKLCTKS
jgi:hypothetical protein